MTVRARVRDRLWAGYVWPKGRLGNYLQGLVLGGLESRRVRRAWNGAERILLVHTPGKVGSMAIFTAIAASKRPADAIFHTHRINPDNLANVGPERKGLAPRRTWYTADFLGQQLRRPHDKDVVVLAAVRDPVERSLSAFLQNVERYSDSGRPITASSRIDVDDLTRQFVRHLSERVVTRWVEAELNEMFGVDLFATPFDNSVGYQIETRGRVRVGVIRHDRFADALAPFLDDMTGLPAVAVGRVNDSSNKAYASIHSEMRKTMRLPPSMVEAMYSSPYARHFFTSEERQVAMLRWSAGSNGGVTNGECFPASVMTTLGTCSKETDVVM